MKSVLTRTSQNVFDLWIVPTFSNILHCTVMSSMNNFEFIGAKVTFTPLFYYKIYKNKPYKHMFTIYDDEKYEQKDLGKFCCLLSLC